MKPKLKIRSGDKVVVLQGRDRGRQGKVKKILLSKRMVIVEGMNVVKKHVKARGSQPGGILEVEKPLFASKVMVICPHCQAPTRVSFRLQGDKKIRVCRHCGEALTGGKNAG